MHDYCTDAKLTVTASKTKIIFQRQGPECTDVFFGNVKLEVAYLDITFSYNGLFNRAIANSVEKAMKAKFSLLVKAGTLQLLADVTLDLFEKTIVPVMLYGSEL